jgi:hypothetical protein
VAVVRSFEESVDNSGRSEKESFSPESISILEMKRPFSTNKNVPVYDRRKSLYRIKLPDTVRS